MGHPQDDQFPHARIEGGAVEYLVEHLSPSAKHVGGVGEQSEYVAVAATRDELADRFGLLFDVGERNARHRLTPYRSVLAARVKVQSRVTKGSSTLVPSGATPGSWRTKSASSDSCAANTASQSMQGSSRRNTCVISGW